MLPRSFAASEALKSFTLREPFLMSLVVTVLSLICLPVMTMAAVALPLIASTSTPAATTWTLRMRWVLPVEDLPNM